MPQPISGLSYRTTRRFATEDACTHDRNYVHAHFHARTQAYTHVYANAYTQRFEGIDSEFKELMKGATMQTNVLEACSVDGREEGLRSMKERLELCQKSLNEYLDVKKKIFPRFYFVSAIALLDMLANGTNPPKIIPYLGDCYDSLNDVIFIDDPENPEIKSIKTVDTMIAKDKEVMMMFEPFTMEVHTHDAYTYAHAHTNAGAQTVVCIHT